MASWEEPPLPRSFDSVFYGAAGGGEDLPSDDQFNRVSFLSHFDGANNGVNNAFDDGSASNHTVTANGNVTQGSFGPFARPDGEFSVSFDGSGDYLQAANSADWDLGTGNFTWECYANITDITRTQWFFSVFHTGSGQNAWGLRLESNGTLNAYFDENGDESVSTIGVAAANSGLTENAWHHIAVVKNGTGSNNIQIYVDGVSRVTGTYGAIFDTNLPFRVGRQGNDTYAQYFLGQISNIRIIKGTALYTGNFTPSTSKLTAITNTKLLTCQSNRFIDNSSSGHTVTPSGNAAVTAFGPFLTSSVYDAAVNGASAYFDGSGDYLTVATSSDFDLGTGDFTISTWLYSTNNNSIGILGDMNISGGTDNYQLWWNHSVSQIRLGTNNLSNMLGWAVTLNLNSWNNIVVSRASGAIKFFFNGTEITSRAADIGDLDGAAFNAPTPVYIGIFNDGTAPLNGYATDVRIIKGTAVNPSGIPAAPLTAITNTKLLLNIADGQAIDSAAQNNLTLVADSKISTAQKKIGTSSLYVDGSGDYVTFPNTPFGTGDFTVECWVRCLGTSYDKGIWDNHTDSGSSDGLTLTRISEQQFRLFGTGELIRSGNFTITNTWVNVTVVRSSGTLNLFVNGVSQGTTTFTTNLNSSSDFVIGGGRYSGGPETGSLNAYIDEFRTSHMARYTSNFTPATEPFADKGQ